MPEAVDHIDFKDGAGPRALVAESGIISVSVNGVAQTVDNHSVDLDVASNLITEEQWTSIQSILA